MCIKSKKISFINWFIHIYIKSYHIKYILIYFTVFKNLIADNKHLIFARKQYDNQGGVNVDVYKTVEPRL